MKVFLLNNFHKFHIYPNSKCFQHKQPLVCIYHQNTREYFQIYQCLLLNLIILFLCSFYSRPLSNHRACTCSVVAVQSQTSIYYQKFHFLQSHYFHLLKHCLQVQAFIHFQMKLLKVLFSKFIASFLSFRPGVDGERGEQNFGQIFNVTFRKLRPYRLSMGNHLVYL